VVVNIVNHLPRHGGIESSHWAPKNNPDKIPTSESIQGISPKKGFRNKGFSKNASHKNRFSNNGFFKKIDPRNDSHKVKMSLVSSPPDPKAEVIVPEAHKSRGVNPLAEEFIPFRKQKSPVADSDPATSIYAVEAPGLGAISKYSLSSSRTSMRTG
jgi:hypothetical protein